jgi:PKD repeat protein
MKKLLFGLLAIVLLIGTVACSKSEEATWTPAATTTTAYVSSGVKAPAPVVTPAPTVMVTAAPGVQDMTKPSSTGGETYNAAPSVSTDRMVIRSAYMALVVDDISVTIAKITSLATTYGGFVVSSDMGEDQNRLYGSISIRVLSSRFNEALQALRDLAADVKSETTSGQDVTEQYTDLASQLRNLEASEAQLLELMKQAGKVTEILEVQRELTDTRGQIEQIKGQMQYLEQSSDMSFISTTLEQSKLVIEFNAETRTVKEGESVQFYPTISGGFSPYTYEWDFGDDETSTDEIPSHAYHSDGAFTVTLNVKDDKGNTAESIREDYITVLPGWNAGNIASTAWHGVVGFFRVLLDIIIWLGIFSPVWIIILVILYFAWWRRRKKAK